MKFSACVFQGLPGLFIQCHLVQPVLSYWHSVPARLVPCRPLSTPPSCQPAALGPLHLQGLTHTHLHSCLLSLLHTHIFSILPKSHQIFLLSFLGVLREASPASLQPIACSLPTISLALDSLLCLALVNHRLPCTFNDLLDTHFSLQMCSMILEGAFVYQVLQKTLEWNAFLNLKALLRYCHTAY